MSCKYDIIDEGGRKRVRALRPFTVQGRDVCPMELGGYVYDANTLSQDGNCWIFSGSLEYPGVRVMDEAIVDMGSNLPKAIARPKSVIISGNSRIMGAISFESASTNVLQTPAMFEKGGYTAMVGTIPVKASDGSRIRIAASVFGGSVGKVAVTSASYEARLISLDSDGIVTNGGTWTAGGPDVTLTTTSPYFLVEVRKTPSAAITPADITAAGVTITSGTGSSLDINNSAIVPVYNGVPTNVANILRIVVYSGSGSMFNSYNRIECATNLANTVYFNAHFIKVNHTLAVTGGTSHHISGVFRNSNVESQKSVGDFGGAGGRKSFDVSDCPNFAYDPETFPDLTAMRTSGKTFYFKNCNMPVGSAIHYYDPKVNVWDNIDFSKASEHLGKTLLEQEQTILVSSNVEGMYRLYRNADDKVFGMLVQDYASVEHMGYGALESSYDSVVYSDCVLDGVFNIIGCNVFGGTLGGASKVHSTSLEAVEINGNFRIEGNAQIEDTPLKGTGYIGGNAELKNGNVEGYIYMQDNAKYTPAKVETPQKIQRLVMFGNSKVLKQTSTGRFAAELRDNAVINAKVTISSGGSSLHMSGDTMLERSDESNALLVYGIVRMRDKATVAKTGYIAVYGDVELVGGFNLSAGSRTIYGKHVIASPDDVNRPELPPTKATW